MKVERFAPSPTGLLHLGHAFSALTAWDSAVLANGKLLLRIEDIDQPRCKPKFETAIYEDLEWLGVSWEEPVLLQSQRMPKYKAALLALHNLGLTYECSCNRSDITAALSAVQEGAEIGPDGPVYPGTCKALGANAHKPKAMRLNMQAAMDHLALDEIVFSEPNENFRVTRDYMINNVGDIVLARKDIGTSYHIAVVVDDADQSITHVTRGRDMRSATYIHVLLQRLLGLSTPTYIHHRLIRDKDGKRLAKRNDALAIRTLKDRGFSPHEIMGMIDFKPSA